MTIATFKKAEILEDQSVLWIVGRPIDLNQDDECIWINVICEYVKNLKSSDNTWLHSQAHTMSWACYCCWSVGLNSAKLPPIGMYCLSIIKLPDEWEFASPLPPLSCTNIASNKIGTHNREHANTKRLATNIISKTLQHGHGRCNLLPWQNYKCSVQISLNNFFDSTWSITIQKWNWKAHNEDVSFHFDKSLTLCVPTSLPTNHFKVVRSGSFDL